MVQSRKHLGVLSLLVCLGLGLLMMASSAQANPSENYKNWKKCGHLAIVQGAPPVRIRAKRVSCFKAVEVLAQLLVNEPDYCTASCSIDGWRCHVPKSKGILCVRKAQRVRALPVTR